MLKTFSNIASMAKRLTGIIPLIVTMFMVNANLKAQQLPQYTQFAINPFLFNPAVAGTEDFVHIQAGARSQWEGISGAPRSGHLTAHSPIGKQTIGQTLQSKFAAERWSSLGGVFTYDVTGPIRQSAAYISYAYNIPISLNGTRLSFGANAGVRNFGYNPDGYSENILDQNDPVISSSFNTMMFDVAMGFWLYNSKYFVGLSSFQILENKLGSPTPADNGFATGSLLRHYYAMAGFKVNVNKDIYMVPSAIYKSSALEQHSFDINAKVVYKNDYWLGGGYRHKDASFVYAGLLVGKRLEISYSYDFINSTLNRVSTGSNEIIIGYRLMLDKKVLCPDNFW